MISGIGIDIIEVSRVQKLGSKSPRFLKRVFTPGEIAYCSKKKNKYQHFAGRFAAKEAFFKALGERIPWKDIELINLALGKPTLKLKGKRPWPFKRTHVSVSHLAEYALAIVILEE
jgi:holo-[acyl-carrier protein] synthase